MAPEDSGLLVVFVCTGNTCRSPMATAVLERELEGSSSRVSVGSAGVRASEGEPASRLSIEVAERSGFDLSGHRSRRATPELLRTADLVLVMERSHVEAVQRSGAVPERVFVLSEWPEPGEPELVISDPFGGSIEAYEECWRRIRRHVQRAAPRVIEAARARSV